MKDDIDRLTQYYQKHENGRKTFNDLTNTIMMIGVPHEILFVDFLKP